MIKWQCRKICVILFKMFVHIICKFSLMLVFIDVLNDLKFGEALFRMSLFFNSLLIILINKYANEFELLKRIKVNY